MFVVYLEPRKGARPAEPPYKAFSEREAADAYASDQLDWAAVAEVWAAPGTEDPADAVAAVGKLKSEQAAARREEALHWPKATPGSAPSPALPSDDAPATSAGPTMRNKRGWRATPLLATLFAAFVGWGAWTYFPSPGEVDSSGSEKPTFKITPPPGARPCPPADAECAPRNAAARRDAAEPAASPAVAPDPPAPAPSLTPEDGGERPAAEAPKPPPLLDPLPTQSIPTVPEAEAPQPPPLLDPLPTQSIPDGGAKAPARKPRTTETTGQRAAQNNEKAKAPRPRSAAASYCESRGGRSATLAGVHGQYGVCRLPNGRTVEEWRYYRMRGD